MIKHALHADDRLKERTRLSPEVLTRLRRQVLRRRLPRGTHHVRLGTEGYAVLKDVGGRHVVATVLSRNMRPPGKELTFAKVAQLPTAPQGVPGVPIPKVYLPGQSPQERAARASLPPLASGAAESLGVGLGAGMDLAQRAIAGKADKMLGGYPSAGLKALGRGAWAGADKLQRAIYGDQFIDQYNRRGGMAGAAASALGSGGMRAAREVGTTLGDASALTGLSAAASIASSGGQNLGTAVVRAGKQAGQFVKNEVTNAADTIASAGMRPAYAFARGFPSNVPATRAPSGSAGGAFGPVRAPAPLMMDATGRRVLSQYGAQSPEGVRAVKSGRETTAEFLSRPEVQRVLRNPANPPDPKVGATMRQFDAYSGGYDTYGRPGNTPDQLGYARRLIAGDATRRLIGITGNAAPDARSVLQARQLAADARRDLRTHASGRHVPKQDEVAFPGLAYSSQVADAAAPQTNFLFRGNAVPAGQRAAYMSRHPDVAASYSTGRMYDGPTKATGRMYAYPRSELITGGEGPVMGRAGSEFFDPAKLFTEGLVDWRRNYLNWQTSDLARRGSVPPRTGATSTGAPTFEDIARTDFGLLAPAGEYAVRPTRLSDGMPGYAAKTVRGVPAEQMFAPYNRGGQLLPSGWGARSK